MVYTTQAHILEANILCQLLQSAPNPPPPPRAHMNKSMPPNMQSGGRRSPAVACWASDHWVASSNPLRGKFRH